MDELNNNSNGSGGSKGYGDSLEDSDISAYLDRREKVRNFKVNIDDDSPAESFSGEEYMSDLPAYKGEVYFSNHARKRPQSQLSQSPGANPLNSVRTPRPQGAADARPVRKPSATGKKPPSSAPRRPGTGSASAAASASASTSRSRPVQGSHAATGKKPNANGRPAGNGTAAASGKGKKKKKKNSGIALLSNTLKVLISVALCTAILSGVAITCINDVLAINKDSEPVTVEIPDNATTNEIIDILGDSGLVSRPMMCKLFFTLVSKIKGNSDPAYIGGIFYLKGNMGLEGMLNKLKETQNYSETVTLSFPEGWSVYQIFNKLEKYEVCDADYLYKAAEGVNFNYPFLFTAKEQDSDDRYLVLEGYFFPDTYEFFIDLNANSVIERFLENFENKWTAEYGTRAQELGMSVDEIIKIASIIQREAANDEQMAVISSVIHNRLNASVNYPTLDCDSTYNYITSFVKPITGEVLADRYMKQYNTYICDGLPAGAICNPGDAAIYAALYPEETDYYYFQHDSKGKIYLARTNAEHDKYKDQIALENAR